MASSVASLYRRLRHGEPIVVVSGLPRSGTSMAMKMLAAGGMPLVTDGQRAADEDNPKGYFEDERVKSLAQAPDKSWLRGARGKAIKIISYLLPELPPSHNYRVLFLHRDFREVLASQSKMLAHRGETSETPDERMLELFRSHLDKVGFLLRYRPWFECLDLAYTDVLADPRAAAAGIQAFLRRPLDLEAMAGAVDPNLYRNRAGAGS